MPKSKIQQIMDARKELDVAPVVFVGAEPPAAELQEQSGHNAHFVKSTTPSAPATTKEPINWEEIAAGLRQQSENIEQQIHLIQKELTASQARLDESRDALQLLLNPPRWSPPVGEFALFDQLQQVVENQATEQDRVQKLAQVEQAIALGELLIQQREKQINLLRRELTQLQEELTWCEKYAPHLKRFQASYQPLAAQQEEIRRHSKNLFDRQNLLVEVERLADEGTPEEIRRWAYQNRFDHPKQAIATYKEAVLWQQQQLERASKPNEKHFRQYIKSRVDISQFLENFTAIQQQYQQTLAEFIPHLQRLGVTLGLSNEDIGRIATLNLPKIQVDTNGRITVI